MKININDNTRIASSQRGWDIQKITKEGEWVSRRYYSNVKSALISAFEIDLASYNKSVLIDNIDKTVEDRIDKFISKLSIDIEEGK